MRRLSVPVLCALLGLTLIAGCNDSTVAGSEEASDSTQVARPDGWTEASHGKGATPDYDSLFAQNKVQTLVLELSDSAYQAMWDDMSSIVGPFGVGGTMGGGPGNPAGPDTGMIGPPGGIGVPDSGLGGAQAAIDAAVGKAVGDSCVVQMGGMSMAGTVQAIGGVNLCLGGGGSIPDGGGMMDDALTNMLSREPAYVPADMHLGGRTWWKIGLRPKGNSSLIQSWQAGSKKLPFRLDIDRFEDIYPEIKNERVWGFGKLSLNSAAMDASLMRERLASDIFRDAGVPTTRESFVRVVMKHGAQIDTLGLYALVEVPDDPFLEAWFGSGSGNLYKPEGAGARFSTLVDSAFLADAGDISDVRAMYYALHSDRTDTAAWRARMEATFDVAGFLKWLAVNTLIRNWDAYGQMAHNYYLYGDNGRLRWITWDMGLAFQSGQGGVSVWHGSVDSTWPLIYLFLRDSKYRAAYRAELESILGGAFEPSRVTAKVGAWKSMIEPYLTAAERPAFASGVSTLESFIRDRAPQVETELAGTGP